eukprot:Rhum_TRINITY_DN11865_c0_g2::Rhum_TRINITY_DN11865_c0_g2_i1::g.47510::m.47510
MTNTQQQDASQRPPRQGYAKRAVEFAVDRKAERSDSASTSAAPSPAVAEPPPPSPQGVAGVAGSPFKHRSEEPVPASGWGSYPPGLSPSPMRNRSPSWARPSAHSATSPDGSRLSLQESRASVRSVVPPPGSPSLRRVTQHSVEAPCSHREYAYASERVVGSEVVVEHPAEVIVVHDGASGGWCARDRDLQDRLADVCLEANGEGQYADHRW